MAHLQYMPGDPRLVDQLVCELKSKGIFDQFRKECIADVDTRPAYQNLRQRVESSVASFLSRQVWRPDLNKNQLREKLRKHLLDGNYLEQGVERIVDQVVNPKVASVFIPQVEDLVYNYLGIPRKKASPGPETSNGKLEDLLPTDLEAVSPGSVKSNDDNEEDMDTSDSKPEKMEVEEVKADIKEDSIITIDSVEKEKEETRLSGISELTIHDSDISIDKITTTIPLPAEEIKLENIPAPEYSPPKINDKNIDLEKIELPMEPNLSTDIPLPDEIPKMETDSYFKPIALHSEDDNSSDSSLRRNMSPLTPIRNFNNENSCDAQQAFENDSDDRSDEKTEPSSFRFAIDAKSSENSSEDTKVETKEETAYQSSSQSITNIFNAPMFDDSSDSHNLQIDYESDANSKATDIMKAPEVDQNSVDAKKEKKDEKKSSSHKSSHKSRDSHRHSSSKDKKSDSKHSSRDSSRHDKDKKSTSSSSKDEKKDKSSSKDKEKSSDKSEKKDSRESSKHRSSSSSHKSSRDKDSKHRSDKTSRSTSSGKHSSKDDKKSSSSSSRDKEKSEKSSDKYKHTKERSKDNKSSSSSKDKDRKSSSSSSKRSDEKENKEKRDKKQTDDHYSVSGRGNPKRRSTDRDSNDGSSSSKGSHNQTSSKTSESKKESKSSSKSGTTSSSDSTSPSDGVEVTQAKTIPQSRPVIRVDTRLETPIGNPPRLPFVPNVTLKKPRIAANFEEAKRMMKMRKFLEEEQKRMNQEAALLLEFQANVRPSLSQVYSSIPGPELEFVCNNAPQKVYKPTPSNNNKNTTKVDTIEVKPEKVEDKDDIAKTLIAMHEDGQNIAEYSHLVDPFLRTNASVLEVLSDKKEVKEQKVIVSEFSTDMKVYKVPEIIVSEVSPAIKVEKAQEIIVSQVSTVNKVDKIQEISVSEVSTDIKVEKTQEIIISEVSTDNKVDKIQEISVSEVSTDNKVDKVEEIIVSEVSTDIKVNKEEELITLEDLTDRKGNKDKEIDVIELSEMPLDDSFTVEESKPEIENVSDKSESVHENTDVVIENENKMEIKVQIDVENVKEEISETQETVETVELATIETVPLTTIETSNDKTEEIKTVEDSTNNNINKKSKDQNETINLNIDKISSAQNITNDSLKYFSEQEKFDAELERDKLSTFLKKYTENLTNKIYLINCDTYEENIIREVAQTMGQYEIVNFFRNGHFAKSTKNIVKNINVCNEITLPTQTKEIDRSITPFDDEIPPIFSPNKSECSFDLSSDYNAKIEDMVNKTSRQEIMEIILGGVIDELPSEMPKIDYCVEANIEVNCLKRKATEVESTNNNRPVLTPNKLRRLSVSDQISSTTGECEEAPNTKVSTPLETTKPRSKYLGKARRVGLPKPKKSNIQNSPSSDKSVENYETNTPPTPNGKIKVTPRSKVQRYDTSDLYKPKLHYLSRRNQIT